MAACGFVGSDAFREDASQERPRASFSDEISNDPDINLGATETKTNTYISTMIFTCLGLLRMVEEEVPIVKHFSGKKCQLPATFLAQKGRKVIKRVVPTRINSVILWGNNKNGYSMLWHLQCSLCSRWLCYISHCKPHVGLSFCKLSQVFYSCCQLCKASYMPAACGSIYSLRADMISLFMAGCTVAFWKA